MSAAQPDLWTRPSPAIDNELEAHKLPFDVQVGSTIFRKGTSLLALVQQHRALFVQVHNTQETFRGPQ